MTKQLFFATAVSGHVEPFGRPCNNNNNKRPLTPKSVPPAGDGRPCNGVKLGQAAGLAQPRMRLACLLPAH